MNKVIVKSNAFEDPRLAELGRLVRMDAAAIGWRLAFTWSWIADATHPLMSVALAAKCIGRKVEVVRSGLLRVGLAREHDATTLDLHPLTELFLGSSDDEIHDPRLATEED